MKNIIKMSLAAAVAVAGISTSAVAVDNVTFSGKLYVENHLSTTSNPTAAQTTAGITADETASGFEVDFDVTGKMKISDTLTAVVGIEADTDQNENVSYTNQTVTVDDAYFAYANNGVAVKFGKQGISTPTTDAEFGQGTLASYTMGSITAVGAHFTNNNSSTLGTNDVSAVALLGTTGPVNFELWRVGVQTKSENMTAVVSTKVAGWTLGARHATTDYDDATKDGSTTIISASGKIGTVGLTALAIKTDKDNAAFVTDASSKNTAELTYFTAKGLKDASAYVAIASMPLTDVVSATVKFGTVQFDQTGNDSDSASEVVAQLNYKLAASTTLTARYSDYTQEIKSVTTDKAQARIDLTYKF